MSVNYLLVVNLEKQNGYNCAVSVMQRLKGEARFFMDSSCEHIFGVRSNLTYGRFSALLEKADILIAVGGDGTIIHAAKQASGLDKPLVGVNTGKVGFLARIEQGDLTKLDLLRRGEYTIHKRMLLKAMVQTRGESSEYLALNDFVLTDTRVSHMMEIGVTCDGSFFETYRADGLIFCTPTGSTAYSMSAGGPVLDPGHDSIVMTPICPQSLFSRSIVFSPERSISVDNAHTGSTRDLSLSIDGEAVVNIGPNSRITIAKAECQASFIDFGDSDFYEVLNRKAIYRG